MKRDISDLLDSYQEENIHLTGGTPLSPSHIKELTMDMIEKDDMTQKKAARRPRFPARMLMAAAVAAALTVSALAADYVLGAGSLLGGLFARGEKELTPAQVEVMDQIGKTFEGGVTSNGATITPVAALADEHVYYLRLRVEAPEGTVLPDLAPEEGYYQLSGTEEKEKMILTPAENAYESFGWDLSTQVLPDADPTDNVKDLVLYWTAQGEGMAFNDGISKLLTIHGLWVQSAEKEYTPVFTGEFTFDIGLNFESRTEALDCGGAMRTWTAQGETYTDTLEALTLSPLSVTYTMSTDLPANPWVGVGPALRIVMKDGSVFLDDAVDENKVDEYLASTGKTLPPPGGAPTMEGILPPPNGTTSGDQISGFRVFDEPLDLSQVDYVQFGETKIPLFAE